MTNSIARRLPAWIVLLALVVGWGAPAAASEEQRLIDKATFAVEDLRGKNNFSNLEPYFAQAKAVIIFPELVKAGFILGGEVGDGVMLVRDSDSGEWSYPAFYTLGSASIGMQFGAQVSQVMLLVMTEGGMDKVMSDKLTLGADASVAAGTVGGGVEAATTLNIDADIYSFSLAKGLFGGISLEGAVLVPDEEAAEAYYGKAVSSRAIVIHREVSNPGADGIRAALAKP
jgi:lipid-binding SYLF domain-containing protein